MSSVSLTQSLGFPGTPLSSGSGFSAKEKGSNEHYRVSFTLILQSPGFLASKARHWGLTSPYYISAMGLGAYDRQKYRYQLGEPMSLIRVTYRNRNDSKYSWITKAHPAQTSWDSSDKLGTRNIVHSLWEAQYVGEWPFWVPQLIWDPSRLSSASLQLGSSWLPAIFTVYSGWEGPSESSWR